MTPPRQVLEKGMEELLTVNKLKLPLSLKKLFGSTNMTGSCYSPSPAIYAAMSNAGGVRIWRCDGLEP